MKPSWARAVAWLWWILVCLLFLIQLPVRWRVVVHSMGGSDAPQALLVDSFARILYLIAMVLFATMGLWLLERRERSSSHIAWLMLLTGLVVALETFCSVYTIWGLTVQAVRPPLVLAAAWVQHWIWTSRIALLFIFLPLLFPDGQLPSPWWRPLFWATVALHVSGLLPYAFAPIPLENNLIGLVEIANPFAISSSSAWGSWLRPLPIVAALPALVSLWRTGGQQRLNLRRAGIVLYFGSLVGLIFLPGLLQIALLCLLAVSSQLWRYRRATRIERQQIQTLALVIGLAGVLWAGSNLVWWVWRAEGEFVRDVLAVAYRITLIIAPVALGMAILRHRLWDIDLILNRTLVYAALSTFIIATYALIVSGLGLLFQSDGQSSSTFAPSLLATGVIAMLFQPVRQRLQTTTNRWLFGERDDPASVLTRLTSQLETAPSGSSLLTTLVETIAASLKLPHVSLWLQNEDGIPAPVAQFGSQFSPQVAPSAEWVESLPLVHRQETIGQLVVAPRSPGEALSAADQQLLAAIARLTATTVRTIQLTDQVQEARVRTVSAREEERRRLRRDLHDGLGPVLASQGLKLAAARQLLRQKPEVAEQLLDDVMQQSHSTVAEVRRLVYALRPPTLDEFGLLGAIREHVETVAATSQLQIEINAPAKLPEIPAAVEVAAYRIVQEALNNVIRHARAGRCTITITLTTTALTTIALDKAPKLPALELLQINIWDDGVGLPEGIRSGVGLLSMRERAVEVGGNCNIANRSPNGVVVDLTLPLERNVSP